MIRTDNLIAGPTGAIFIASSSATFGGDTSFMSNAAQYGGESFVRNARVPPPSTLGMLSEDFAMVGLRSCTIKGVETSRW